VIIGGAFQALEGLAAVVNDQWLVVRPEYIFAFDLTVWGVIHLLVGLALLAIGIFFLLRGQTWARVAWHGGGSDLGNHELRLSAVLTVVGDPDHRY
jgi:hypothetical protein